jgi:DNA repair exonuclease SbcCD ATPase subunit
MIDKLELVLSDQSGAADDLVGVALQLSASAWLRAERGSAWSTVLIDEPFGQLDAAHRRALSAHLSAMLAGRYGFEQAMVIAHHASVLDALPGRIEVIGEGGRSRVRVVA